MASCAQILFLLVGMLLAAPVLASGCSLMMPFEDKPYEWIVGPDGCFTIGDGEVCDRAYMADRATVQIHEIDAREGGRVSLDLLDARLVEWLEVSDHLVADGACFTIDSWHIEGTLARVNM